MKILAVFGEHNYGNPSRGEGYEYVNLLPAFKRLGHEVSFFDSWNRSYYSNFRELNRALLKAVERERPDIVFSVQMHYEVWLETWEILRDSGICTTINWTTDDSWKYDQFSRLVAPAFHAFTTTYPDVHSRYQRDGITNVFLTQWGASAESMCLPVRASDCQHEVSFVGSAHGRRPEWIADLRRRGIEVECFGHGWPRGAVAGEEIPDIIRRSVISLNFSDGATTWNGLRPTRTKQIKARTFEVPGAGGFLLTEWAPGLENYYQRGREIAVFRTVDDLCKQIRHYTANPGERDAVAEAGHTRTRDEHSYDKRLGEVLDYALSLRSDSNIDSRSSMSGTIDWGRFERATGRHKVGPLLDTVRKCLTTPCTALWGPARGPRAARRLLFELSWRISGRGTYSAAGWPGRMFYEAS